MSQLHLLKGAGASILCSLLFSCSTSYFSALKSDQFENNVALHELHLEVEDIKQSLQYNQKEMDSLEEKFHQQESELVAVKNFFSNHKASADASLTSQISSLEKRLYEIEQKEKAYLAEISSLRSYANQTISTLSGQQEKLLNLENKSQQQERRLDDIANLKKTLTSISQAVSNKNREPDSISTHTVQAGDTLEKLARHYRVTAAALKEANNLKSDRIYTGQKLKIPGS